jgi:hypothetical protein
MRVSGAPNSWETLATNRRCAVNQQLNLRSHDIEVARQISEFVFA